MTKLLLVLLSFGMTSYATPKRAYTAVEQNMQRQIQNARDAGEGDLTAQALRRKVTANPDDLTSRLEFAAYYSATGFPDVALEHYRIAAQRNPANARVAILLAKTLRGLSLAFEARQSLEAFAVGNPDAPGELWSWLGMMQDDAGDFSVTEANHKKALSLQPNSDSAHNNLGYNLLLQGKEAEAAAEFRKALAIAPHSAVAQNNLGLALASLPGDALASLQSASDRATAHNNLGAVLIEKQKYAEARRQINLALGYKNDHPAALRNLQLLSEIDGGGLNVPIPDGRSGWNRFVHGLHLMFLGDQEPASPKGPVKTASR